MTDSVCSGWTSQISALQNAIPDRAARERLISRYDHDHTEPEWALAFAFDIVLRGRAASPFEQGGTDG